MDDTEEIWKPSDVCMVQKTQGRLGERGPLGLGVRRTGSCPGFAAL